SADCGCNIGVTKANPIPRELIKARSEDNRVAGNAKGVVAPVIGIENDQVAGRFGGDQPGDEQQDCE
ncbi:MAG: hypothetical protein RIR52_2222, partial [Acidobacteriota bacterium]